MSWAESAKQRGDLQRAETVGRLVLLRHREAFVETAWVGFDRARIELIGRERKERSEREARAAADTAAAERVQAARRRIVRDEQKARIVLREIVNRAYRELEQMERESFHRVVRQGGNGHQQGAGDSYRPSPVADRRRQRRKPAASNDTVTPTRATTAEVALRMLAESVAKASSPEESGGPVTVSVADGGEFRYVIPASANAAGKRGYTAAAIDNGAATAPHPGPSAADGRAVLMFVPNGAMTAECSTYPRAAKLDRLDATKRECDRAIGRLQVVVAAATALQRCGRGHVARVKLHGDTSGDPVHHREPSRQTLKEDSLGAAVAKARQSGTNGNTVAAMVALRKFERDFSIPEPTELKRPKSVSPSNSLKNNQAPSSHSKSTGMLTPQRSVAAMVRRDSTVRARVARTDSRIGVRARPPLATSLIADADLQQALGAVSPVRLRGKVGLTNDPTAGACDDAGDAREDEEDDRFFHLGASLRPLEGNISGFVNRIMRMTPAERSYQRQERLRLMEVRQRAVDTEVFDRSHALKQAETAAAASKTQRGVKSTARLESHRLLRGRRRLEEARAKATAVAAQERAKFLEQEAAEMRAVSRHVHLRQSILAEDPETALSHTAARVPGAAKHISAVQREVVKDTHGDASRLRAWRLPQATKSRDGLRVAIDEAERDTLRRTAPPRPARASTERARGSAGSRSDSKDVSIPHSTPST